MTGATIKEAAERSGFPPSTLRYYDEIGLVTPERTGAGYRVYDDAALRRLTFIGRAKQLGCSLEEITDLVEVWDGEDCGPVQRRLHHLVTTKTADTQHQITELAAFASQLRAAAAHLAGPATDGPCSAGCACVSEGDAGASAWIGSDDPPVEAGGGSLACTLEPTTVPDRLADWGRTLGTATDSNWLPDGGLRITLGPRVDLAELARLMAAELECCSFFSFVLTIDQCGSEIEVHATVGATDVLTTLFGPPSGVGRSS